MILQEVEVLDKVDVILYNSIIVHCISGGNFYEKAQGY